MVKDERRVERRVFDLKRIVLGHNPAAHRGGIVLRKVSNVRTPILLAVLFGAFAFAGTASVAAASPNMPPERCCIQTACTGTWVDGQCVNGTIECVDWSYICP